MLFPRHRQPWRQFRLQPGIAGKPDAVRNPWLTFTPGKEGFARKAGVRPHHEMHFGQSLPDGCHDLLQGFDYTIARIAITRA